jgi:hypothetical protein
MPPTRLRIVDFSDRELLSLLVEARDGEGWASARDIADLPALRSLDNTHPHRMVAARLGWLFRYGVVEREYLVDKDGIKQYVAGDPDRPKYTQRWRLTALGEAYLSRRLTQRQQSSIANMEDERLIDLTAMVTARARSMGPTGRWLLNREWRYGTAEERL